MWQLWLIDAFLIVFWCILMVLSDSQEGQEGRFLFERVLVLLGQQQWEVDLWSMTRMVGIMLSSSLNKVVHWISWSPEIVYFDRVSSDLFGFYFSFKTPSGDHYHLVITIPQHPQLGLGYWLVRSAQFFISHMDWVVSIKRYQACLFWCLWPRSLFFWRFLCAAIWYWVWLYNLCLTVNKETVVVVKRWYQAIC